MSDISETVVIGGDLKLNLNVIGDGSADLFSQVDGGVGIIYTKTDYHAYTGEHVVIPSSEETVLQTKDLLMIQNITVKPIPSNYGLITWNGSVLTVS